MFTDLLVALRRLRQSPGYTAFAVVTLALAIGVTTAVYSLVRTGLQPDLGVRNADRFMAVANSLQSMRRGAVPMSWLDYQDVTQAPAFDAVVAWSPFTTALFARGTSEFTHGELVSDNYFSTTGTRAVRGRLLDESDAVPGAPPVAVLSGTLWRSRFHRDPGIVGAPIKIAGQPFQIVGVAPDWFHGIDRPQGFGKPDLWVPLSAAPSLAPRYARQDPNRRDHQWLKVVGRLAPTVTRETAATGIAALGQRLDLAAPLPPTSLHAGGTTPTPRSWITLGIEDPIDFGEAKDVLRVVLLLPALVLLVACTNLANFSLSRGLARQHEIAVRQAVGASRWQLMRGQMTEYGLIALAGALGGVAVADRLLVLVSRTVREVGGEMPQFRVEAVIDGGVLLAVGGAALLSVLVAGFVPALQLTRRNLARSMADNQALASLPKWRGRSNLIALQVSVSVALLLVSALCVRQLPKLQAGVDTGIHLDRVAVVSVPFSMHAMSIPQADRIANATVDAVRQLPGVKSAALGSARRITLDVFIGPAGQTLRPGQLGQPTSEVLYVSPDYFATTGIGLVEGRSVGATDIDGSERVAVISKSQARRLFGAGLVAGRRASIQLTASRPVMDVTVIGVADDTRSSRGTLEDFIYLPLGQKVFEETPTLEFLALAEDTVDPASLAVRMRDTLRRLEPEVAVSFVGRADAQDFGPATALRMFALCFGSLAFLALGFAMSGLYGVLAHVVARRTRELGVRAALGADPSRLVRMIFREGGRPVLEGVVIGFGIAAGARLGMQPWFTDPVTAVDPVALVIALVPLMAAAALACYLPARRAARVDPNIALREL